MYKKAVGGLALLNLIFLFGFFCVYEVAQERKDAQSAYQTDVEDEILVQHRNSALGIVQSVISGQRVVGVQELVEVRAEKQAVKQAEGQGVRRAGTHDKRQEGTHDEVSVEQEEMEILLRIVEAEAGNQDVEGRLLVANVILNRVENEAFPNNVKDVVLQNANGIYQFSPVASGQIWKVKVSEETGEAVERALAGEDISEGALYFAARKYADSRMMKWFDEKLTFLFEYGGHEFFR